MTSQQSDHDEQEQRGQAEFPPRIRTVRSYLGGLMEVAEDSYAHLPRADYVRADLHDARAHDAADAREALDTALERCISLQAQVNELAAALKEAQEWMPIYSPDKAPIRDVRPVHARIQAALDRAASDLPQGEA